MPLQRFLVLFCAQLLMGAVSAHADVYDDLRLKWRNLMIGTGYDTNDTAVVSRLSSTANAANSVWASMDKSPTRTFLWSDAASTTISAQITASYMRLRSMALAYATPGCSLEGNATLLADLIGGLGWLNTNRYNATSVQYDNWWDWEIGTPLQLTDTCVLLYNQLTGAQLTNYMNAVEHQVPTPDMTHANKVWKARVVGVRGCLVKNSTKLTLCRDAFSAVFPYVTTGDGFYLDGSFIQHNTHPYTAGYGTALLDNMVPVLNWLSGSTWQVNDPAQANLYRWVFDSFEPIIYRGNTFDLVRGREAGRANASTSSHGIMESILEIAQFAPPADAARMKSMIKGWALSDTTRDFVSGRGLPTLQLAQDLMADTNVVPRAELLAHYTFADMDRVIHLGAGYGFGLSLCSTRIANFESINGENLRGWFTGDGQTILYNSDLNAFADAYYATIDQYRLPGVTADVTHNKLPPVPAAIGPRAQGQSTLSPHAWVGGATLGRFGAAGMQFKGVAVTLTGKKSWFMFDDEIVCLGAGITSSDGRPIETTVENRKLASDGANAFTVNGVEKPQTLGWTEAMTNVNWAHLAGNLVGSDIGYYFPTPAAIKGVREARTGAWSDIDSDGATNGITRNYLRMSFEHGSSPANAAYRYVLLPGRSARRMGHYAAAPQIVVLTNTTNVQAARETTLGITAANFWTDTLRTAGVITADRKSSVLVQQDGAFIDVAVSDPTHTNSGTINLQIALDGGTLVSADPAITVTQTTPTIMMSVNVAGASGRTFAARFYPGTPTIISLGAVADAYVHDGANSTTNFGNAVSIVVKKAGTGFNRESFLRFDVPATDGALVGANLKLYCSTASTPGVQGVYKVDTNTWIESGAGGITWDNQPAASAVALSTWTPVVSNVTSVGVGPAITGAGLVSFKIAATTETADGFTAYSSRQNATVTNRPQLALLTGHTPPNVTLVSPADGAFLGKAGLTQIAADAQATDGAVTNVMFYDGAAFLGSTTAPPFSVMANLGGGAHFLTAVAQDANGLSRTSLVTRIDVAHPPVASAGAVATPRNTFVDVDLGALVTDADTGSAGWRFAVSNAASGTVTLLPDGRTARFVPASNYTGAASFAFSVMDTSPDPRALLLYDFQSGDATDASGQGRDGTLNVLGTGAGSYPTNAPAALAPQVTRSLQLTENGTVGAARLERFVTTDLLDWRTNDWTIAGWFRRGAAVNADAIVQLGESGGFANDAMTLKFYGTGSTLELRNYNGSTQDVGISKTNATTNTWHHFAIVRNGGTVNWYFNGAPVGSDTAFTFSFNTTRALKFGGVTTNTLDRWLNGSLADLAVFNEVLSPAEIARLTQVPAKWLGGQVASNSVTIDVLTPYGQWAAAWGLASTNSSGNLDADGDGISNEGEYVAGTNPTAFDSAPMLILTNEAGKILVSFTATAPSGPGYSGLTRFADLLFVTNLSLGSWSGVPGYTNIAGSNQFMTYTNSSGVVSTFYRLRYRLE